MLLVKNNPFVTDGTPIDDSNSISDDMRRFCIIEIWVAGSSEGNGYDIVKIVVGNAGVNIETTLKVNKKKDYS